MKKLLSVLVVTSITNLALAQSDSYETFKDTFRGSKDVFSFRVRGWLARTVLRFANDHEFHEALSDIKTIKVTIVPRQRFREKDLSVKEFKKILRDDSFSELAQVRDDGDDVTIYIQENAKRRYNNRYFILAEESDQVVAIEMCGYVSEESLTQLKKDALRHQQRY